MSEHDWRESERARLRRIGRKEAAKTVRARRAVRRVEATAAEIVGRKLCVCPCHDGVSTTHPNEKCICKRARKAGPRHA